MLTYSGSIEDVLSSGEYDQGDLALIDYDELYDLVEQARFICGAYKGHELIPKLAERETWEEMIWRLQHKSNRPLHPCLGGTSPYSEFLPL